MGTIEVESRTVFRVVIVVLIAIAIITLLGNAIEDVEQTIRWLASAIFLALVLAPAVLLFERISLRGHHPPRWLAILSVYVGGLVLLGVLVLEVIPP